jgi:L-amino acid N-acyltransferase YncA
MSLERKQFKKIDLDDHFFNSLKADYAEFPQWFAKKAEDLAYVFQTDEGAIDGFLYLKVEVGVVSDVTPPLPAERRLKVGTMKINAHSTKLGERFIKKIFDHAIFEGTVEIYVTIFAHHVSLIALFERYGFQARAEKTTQNGTELVLIRVLRCPYSDVITSYPLVNLKNNHPYLLSLYPKWHTRLLPDSILKTEDADVVQDLSHTNSIHKVYLSAMAGIPSLTRGDVLLIYRTSDQQGPAHFRSVATSICVVEEYKPIQSFASCEEFLTYCRQYSVFTEDELASFWKKRNYPHVIRFTYNIAFKKRVTRGTMIEELGLSGDDYWGFLPLLREQFIGICRKGLIDESLIIH